jgi:hypothetical protein
MINKINKYMSGDFITLEKKPSGKKDFTLSILILVVVFLLVLTVVAIKENSVRGLLSAASEKILIQTEEMFSLKEREKETKEKEADNNSEVFLTSIENKVYKEVAQKGDGLTHLARRAVTKYMQEEGVELSKEQRIYVEDYVQKRIATEKSEPRFLDIGEEVEIERELIEEGVEQALKLTPSQIDNLRPYTYFVSF